MELSRSIVVLLNLLLFISVIDSSEYIPVYMWSASRASSKVPGLHKISEKSFKDDMLDWLNKEKTFIVVFAEQTLSPEDFAQYDNSGRLIFSNLAKVKDSMKVSYFPYVQNPIRTLKDLNVELTEVSLDFLIDDSQIPDADVLVINLNDAEDSEDRLSMLKRHDAVVANLYQKISSKHDKVLALYTAHHNSWITSDDVQSRKTRAITDDQSSKFHTTNNAYVYFSLAQFEKVAPESKRENITFTEFTSKFENNTVALHFKGGTREVSFNFSNIDGYYELVEPIQFKDESGTYNIKSTSDLYAPTTFSYHCGDQVFTNGNYTLFFKDFQVQLFFDGLPNVTMFSDAYDCVGFTSVPIWSGLFVTSILLLIITFGIIMMMDIRTMDRFDDAKGKTITVNAE